MGGGLCSACVRVCLLAGFHCVFFFFAGILEYLLHSRIMFEKKTRIFLRGRGETGPTQQGSNIADRTRAEGEGSTPACRYRMGPTFLGPPGPPRGPGRKTHVLGFGGSASGIQHYEAPWAGRQCFAERCGSAACHIIRMLPVIGIESCNYISAGGFVVSGLPHPTVLVISFLTVRLNIFGFTLLSEMKVLMQPLSPFMPLVLRFRAAEGTPLMGAIQLHANALISCEPRSGKG